MELGSANKQTISIGNAGGLLIPPVIRWAVMPAGGEPQGRAVDYSHVSDCGRDYQVTGKGFQGAVSDAGVRSKDFGATRIVAPRIKEETLPLFRHRCAF